LEADSLDVLRLGLGNPSKRGFSPCLADGDLREEITQSKGSRLIIIIIFYSRFLCIAYI